MKCVARPSVKATVYEQDFYLPYYRKYVAHMHQLAGAHVIRMWKVES